MIIIIEIKNKTEQIIKIYKYKFSKSLIRLESFPPLKVCDWEGKAVITEKDCESVKVGTNDFVGISDIVLKGEKVGDFEGLIMISSDFEGENDNEGLADKEGLGDKEGVSDSEGVFLIKLIPQNVVLLTPEERIISWSSSNELDVQFGNFVEL